MPVKFLIPKFKYPFNMNGHTLLFLWPYLSFLALNNNGQPLVDI